MTNRLTKAEYNARLRRMSAAVSRMLTVKGVKWLVAGTVGASYHTETDIQTIVSKVLTAFTYHIISCVSSDGQKCCVVCVTGMCRRLR